MSWLARSIATSLRLDDDENNHHRISDNIADKTAAGEYDSGDSDQSDDEQRGGGMKEDFSELKQTLTRQIWGVASFLAPPPPPPLPNRHQRPDLFAADRKLEVSGEGNEVESAKCRSGGYRDLAQMLPFRLEDQIGGAVGITEESLAFASNIAHHPETWLDFPLSEEEDIDDSDFDMSDAQCKHAEAVERLVPRLAALRIELCPVHMSEGYFWKVYFVLLYSRLNRLDAEMLSTQQVAAARSLWMQELQKRLKPESFQYSSSLYAKENSRLHADDFDPYSPRFRNYTDSLTSAFEPATCATTESDIEKYPIVSSYDSPAVDKSVIREESVTQTREKEAVAGPSCKGSGQQFDDDDEGDDWLEQQSVDGYCGPTIFIGTDDDVTFSDLEEDDDCTLPMKSRSPLNDSDVSSKAS